MNVLYSSSQIRSRCDKLAKRIINDYKYGNYQYPLILIGVLNGSLPFLNDLSRRIDRRSGIDVIVDTLECKSITGAFKRKKPKITKYPSIDLSNKHFILVEDIIDTGATIGYIQNQLMSRYQGISMDLCTFIHRTCSNMYIPKYVGKQVDDPDMWLLGYGMDDEDGTKRNLNQILIK